MIVTDELRLALLRNRARGKPLHHPELKVRLKRLVTLDIFTHSSRRLAAMLGKPLVGLLGDPKVASACQAAQDLVHGVALSAAICGGGAVLR